MGKLQHNPKIPVGLVMKMEGKTLRSSYRAAVLPSPLQGGHVLLRVDGAALIRDPELTGVQSSVGEHI